jgi:hypothetical protein
MRPLCSTSARELHAELSDENRHGEMAADVLLAAMAKSGADRNEFAINYSGRKKDDEICVIITPAEENKMSNYYVAISALIFALVTVAHLVRLIKRWTVNIGPYEVPMTISWAGFVIAALLAIWGFIQSG